MMKFHTFTLYLLMCALCFQFSNGLQNINIGLIVDVGSEEGKIVQSCIAMALSDFYNHNGHYETRVALQVRDYGADSFHTVSAVLDLLENLEVHAILVPKIAEEDLFLVKLGDIANVPLLSFSSISSQSKHPYFLQVAEDETTQFHGIAALIGVFNWTSCVVLYEDNADARIVQSYLYAILQENHVDVVHQVAVSLTSTDAQIIDELNKLIKMRTSIVIMHMPTSLASEVLITANKLGMMSKAFAWIITGKTMNFLEYLNPSVRYKMQGVIGLKPYIPASGRLQDFTLRWRRESQLSRSEVEIGELNVFGLWAYDVVWAIAEAVERIGISPSQNQGRGNSLDLSHLRISGTGPTLLSKIVGNKFVGLAGDFLFVDRKLVHDTYEIVNVIGKSERGVGFWTLANGLSKDLPPMISSSDYPLETIIWPGFSTTVPDTRLLQMNGKGFKVGIPYGYMPELVAIDFDLQKNITTFSGFCVDVFRAAVDRLPYDISYEFVPFNSGSYSDLINKVYLKTYDIAVGDITILANRSEFVDFTLPYIESGPAIVVKLDDEDPWFFLKPFNPYLWILSVCLFVVMGFIVWLIEHPSNKQFQGPLAWKIGTILWFSISTLVFAHREKLKSNLSRFVVGVWLFVVLILTSSYTANLSSLLTIQQIKLTNGDYIGSANSLVQGLTVNNLNFRDHRLKPFQSTEQYDEALTKGSKNGGVSAIIEEIPYIKLLLEKYPLKYTMIESSMRSSGFGLAFTKGFSPLVLEMSRAISGLREEGKLSELEKKWFKNRSPLLYQDTQQIRPNTLGIGNFYGLFIISGISKLIAILILLVILLCKRLSIRYLILRLFRGNLRIMLKYIISPRFYMI